MTIATAASADFSHFGHFPSRIRGPLGFQRLRNGGGSADRARKRTVAACNVSGPPLSTCVVSGSSVSPMQLRPIVVLNHVGTLLRRFAPSNDHGNRVWHHFHPLCPSCAGTLPSSHSHVALFPRSNSYEMFRSVLRPCPSITDDPRRNACPVSVHGAWPSLPCNLSGQATSGRSMEFPPVSHRTPRSRRAAWKASVQNARAGDQDAPSSGPLLNAEPRTRDTRSLRADVMSNNEVGR